MKSVWVNKERCEKSAQRLTMRRCARARAHVCVERGRKGEIGGESCPGLYRCETDESARCVEPSFLQPGNQLYLILVKLAAN
jgi:hypothetical protein